MQLMDQVGTGVNIFTEYILLENACNRRKIDDNVNSTLALHEFIACNQVD